MNFIKSVPEPVNLGGRIRFFLSREARIRIRVNSFLIRSPELHIWIRLKLRGMCLKGSGSEREHGSGSEIELDPGSENGIKTGFEFRLRGFKVSQDPE